jgi:hypothetical protein
MRRGSRRGRCPKANDRQHASGRSRWRRPRSMPIKVWEEVNVRMERQLPRWLQGLPLVPDGSVRKVEKTDAKAIIQPGSRLGWSRAARKKGATAEAALISSRAGQWRHRTNAGCEAQVERPLALCAR